MATHVDFSPLENGLDYMESAVEHLQGNPTSRDLKYAVLHLAAAIEVLLKMRLVREHWSLIFEDVRAATLAKYNGGDFKSVGAMDALTRLTNIASISISEGGEIRVRAIVDKRNRLQHFGLVDSVEAVQSVTARALDFLITFVSAQLRDADAAPTNAVEVTLDRIRGGLAEIESLVNERMTSLSLALSQQHFVVTCPECSRSALTLDDSCRCLFCLYEATPEVAANEYVSKVLGISEYTHVKDGGIWPVVECPSCSRVALVEDVTDSVTFESGSAEGREAFKSSVCFAGCEGWTFGELGSCLKCGQLTVINDEEEDIRICADCMEYMLSKDD